MPARKVQSPSWWSSQSRTRISRVMDVRAKSTGSKQSRNIVNATIAGLKDLKTAESIARLRGKKVEDLLG